MHGYVGMAHIEKKIQVKEKKMFVCGNGFKVQKIKTIWEKNVKWERLNNNKVKLGGIGNLRWQKRKRGCTQEDFDKGGSR